MGSPKHATLLAGLLAVLTSIAHLYFGSLLKSIYAVVYTLVFISASVWFLRRQRVARARSILSKTFLTQILKEKYPDVTVTAVRISNVAKCGDGKASTTDRVTLNLCYANSIKSTKPTPPQTILVKINLLPWYIRPGAHISAVSAAGVVGNYLRHLNLEWIVFFFLNLFNFYLPHAPDAMYINETIFYRHIRDEIAEKFACVRIPECYGTINDQSKCRFGVIMEDLTVHKARFPTALENYSTKQMKSVLKSLASIHSYFWESARFENDLKWVPTPLSGGMSQVFQSIGEGLATDHVSNNTFEQELLQPLKRSVQQLWIGVVKAQKVLSERPYTLCHGDCHISNTFIAHDGAIGLYDFQLCVRASWARDVSYILATAFTPEQRRTHERSALLLYLRNLEDLGVTNCPSFSEAWSIYRKSMAWGLVIGWLMCPPHNYGEEIWKANVKKLVQACVDLETFELLEQ